MESFNSAVLRLRGGGGDGGSTGAESRSTYLEMYAGQRPSKIDPEEERLALWTVCHLSGVPLHPPCVADQLGLVYNKEALVSALLAKTLPPELSYITGLKSLLNLKLELAAENAKARFVCPVTGAEANGKVKFVAIKPHGLVVSERALNDFKVVTEEYAGGRWVSDDILPLNPPADTIAPLRNALVHSKKEKKRHSKRNDAHSVAHSKKKRTECPHGATPEVWNSLFLDSKQKDAKTGCDFLTRGGRGYVA